MGELAVEVGYTKCGGIENSTTLDVETSEGQYIGRCGTLKDISLSIEEY